MLEICRTAAELGQGWEGNVVGGTQASRTIVPSKVYRAYIFPVHWADSSNFRAVCSRARATSVWLVRFREILNCTRSGGLSQVYKFIILARLPSS